MKITRQAFKPTGDYSASAATLEKGAQAPVNGADLLTRLEAAQDKACAFLDDPRIVLSNWTRGGTGLTNFSPEKKALYLAAIKEHGDPNFAIAHAPCTDCKFPIAEDYSLHHVGTFESCMPFWDVFKRIQNELEARSE